MESLLATPTAAALLLGITLGQLRGLIRNGAIPTKKIGGRLYVRRSDLTAYADQPSTAKPWRATHKRRLCNVDINELNWLGLTFDVANARANSAIRFVSHVLIGTSPK